VRCSSRYGTHTHTYIHIYIYTLYSERLSCELRLWVRQPCESVIWIWPKRMNNNSWAHWLAVSLSQYTNGAHILVSTCMLLLANITNKQISVDISEFTIDYVYNEIYLGTTSTCSVPQQTKHEYLFLQEENINERRARKTEQTKGWKEDKKKDRNK
jgi:hypothetical protein